MTPVSLLASGMVTGIGFDSEAACAALRAGISGFADTPFLDRGGEPIAGCAVALDRPWRGREKLVRLIAPAIAECLRTVPLSEPIPLLLCVAERTRPGRISGLDDRFLPEVQAATGHRFHESSRIIAEGRVGMVRAMGEAARLLQEAHRSHCVIAGVDSFLVASTLSGYESNDRLLTSRNSDGFIPGEAGAAVLLGPLESGSFRCLGIGFGQERSTVDSEELFRAEGAVQAVRSALADARAKFEEIDYRLADLSGEQYAFKEVSIAMARTLRVRKPSFPIWHPADCLGEVGAAMGPCAAAFALAAARKGFAPGRGVLCHFGNDDGLRAAMILRDVA